MFAMVGFEMDTFEYDLAERNFELLIALGKLTNVEKS